MVCCTQETISDSWLQISYYSYLMGYGAWSYVQWMRPLKSGVIGLMRRDQGRKQSALTPASVPAGTPEEKLEWLSSTMRESAGLLTEVLAELNDQAVTAQLLDEVVAKAQERAALYGRAADAVTRLVRDELHEEHAKIRSELERQRARIFRDSVVIALISFSAGVIVTLLITLFH